MEAQAEESTNILPPTNHLAFAPQGTPRPHLTHGASTNHDAAQPATPNFQACGTPRLTQRSHYPEPPPHSLPLGNGIIYQSDWPAYLTGPFSLGPRIFSRQCFDSISVRREEVQKEMAKALCRKRGHNKKATVRSR